MCFGLLDSKAEQLPIKLLLLTLPNLQPTLNLPRWDDLSSYVFFGVNEGVEAWKFAGNNSKGFSPVNAPNYPVTVWSRESVWFAVWLP